ncbi:MAG: C4-dicarboxylate ABC transporter permease, partial [Pseudomonadota bacterium]
MLEGILWFFQNLALAFVNFFAAITNPGSWLSWLGGIETEEAKQSLLRVIYYGGSVELFFVAFLAFILLTFLGFWRNSIMWSSVVWLEAIGNTVGRFAAWAGLLMVLQQVMIVFVQRVFASAQISLGFGLPFAKD